MQATNPNNMTPQDAMGMLRQLTAGAEALPLEVGQCLVRAQQMLIQHHRSYVHVSDPDAWPLCAALMNYKNESILIAPLVPGMQDAWAQVWNALGRIDGLILVGAQRVDDPQIAGLLQGGRKSIAYIDARGGKHVARRRLLGAPTPLDKTSLKRFLDPRQGQSVAAIDCPARMRTDLEAMRQNAEFFSSVRSLHGAKRPVSYKILVGLCVAVFAAMMMESRMQPTEETFLAWGALYGPLVKSGQYWRLVTCAFLHGGIIHIAFNGMAMVYLGGMLEMMQGTARFLAVYFFSVVTASLTSILWNNARLSVGASGGIFGLLGAFLAMMLLYYKDCPGGLRRTFWKWIGTVVVYNVAFSLLPIVDASAHAGGFIGGLAMGLVVMRSPIKKQPLSWIRLAAAAVVVIAGIIYGYEVIRRLPAPAPQEAQVSYYRQPAMRIVDGK